MSKKLFKTGKKNYGPDYNSHLFNQYKLYVDSAEKISDRRHNSITLFITINTGLISLIGLSQEIKLFNNFFLIKLALSILGIVVCIIFWFLINSYKQLNTGKFEIIHQIEEKLPLHLYKYEWEILKKGKDSSIYFPFSHIELWMPWVFVVIYIVLAGALFIN